MQMPNVASTIRDNKNNVIYHVLAYRRLSEVELVRSIEIYRAQPKVRRLKKPLKNQVITIVTTIGAAERM